MRFAAIVLFALMGIASPTPAQEGKRSVLFLGDSLTAGYGLSREEAFPFRIAELAARDGIPFDVTNAGASGDTTAGALRRLDWVLRSRPDVLVVCLGANDGLRGLDLERTKSNLIQIVEAARRKFPDLPVLLLPMELPPTFGEPYVSQFRTLFSEAARNASVTLGPFLLERVAGHPELNQPDRLHPNARGHELIAETVWPALRPLLERPARARS